MRKDSKAAKKTGSHGGLTPLQAEIVARYKNPEMARIIESATQKARAAANARIRALPSANKILEEVPGTDRQYNGVQDSSAQCSSRKTLRNRIKRYFFS